jgi:hypothetical protein
VDGVRTDLASANWTLERATRYSTRRRATGTNSLGLVWFARWEEAAGNPGRLRLELRNPLATTAERGQPTCLYLGCPGTKPIRQISVLAPNAEILRARWGDENGSSPMDGGVSLLSQPLELRPGEQYGWEVVVGSGDVETPLLEYPANWSCATGVFGPLVPVNSTLFGDYELHSSVGAVGIRNGRARPHWRNPRDHGEDQRDWDGGNVDIDFQTHNNEYEVHLAYAKQRLRTMGIQAASRDWHYLGLTGTRHFANVDIYHVHEGPLRWLHGASFQHVKHGGSGQSTMHRSSFSPNMGHQTGRGLLAWYYLTGDPLLRESFLEVAQNTLWRVMNGPGMPGISSTDGAERDPANAISILTEAWMHTADPAYLVAAKKAVVESHAKEKPFYNRPDDTDWRAKPWQIALLVLALDEFQEAALEYSSASDGDVAKESAGMYKTYMRKHVMTDVEGARLPYQVSNDPAKQVETPVGSWNVVCADALVDYYPDVAEALFRHGSHAIWFPGRPIGKYTKLLNQTVLSGWGHRYMDAVASAEHPSGATP